MARSTQTNNERHIALCSLHQDRTQVCRITVTWFLGRSGALSTLALLQVMLLSNLTVDEEGSKEMLQLGKGQLEGLNV